MKDPKQIDWNTAPEWANFHTIEPDLPGTTIAGGTWHENKPEPKIDYWKNSGKHKYSQDYDLKMVNWKESLVERPDRAQNQ